MSELVCVISGPSDGGVEWMAHKSFNSKNC